MKAISIKQPWASLIIEGVKDIENRTWKTSYRGTVLIHSSSKPINNFVDIGQFLTVYQMIEAFENEFKLGPLSAILGTVDIVDCVINHPSIWAEKTEATIDFNLKPLTATYKPIYNWVLANPVKFENPILNVKGKLSFWDYNL